ncbi:hypothetical protein CBR_g23998 [Chara braunii]|uniref:Uncharacterized protein n=1 Tax=Chara braunii TaxID=69332 RepID=A0A388L5N3_CHABU|nr:hypothetical protein CBR_g23998 [Chara braunii]|eukprot:GBG77552.1 hypothetical protein CBR_g23998 [Chara braunii]
MTAILDVQTYDPPVFPPVWKFQIENRLIEVRISTRTSPICLRCRERGHLGTDPTCPKFLKQAKERKLLPNMLVEVEDAPGIWFVAHPSYDGWVFDDNLDEPDWVWHFGDQNPSVKKPDVFPPADSRWQKKATGKVRGNPTKINTNPITDSRVIREEKAREDLLWDLDTIREQIEHEINKEPFAFREALKQAEQVDLQTYKRRDKVQVDNKRQLHEDDRSLEKGIGPKRRKAGESTEGKGTETSETGVEGEGMEMDMTGGEGDDEAGGRNNTPDAGSAEEEDRSTQSLTWLRDSVEKAKREREHAFDVRVACLKHAERSQVNGKKNAFAGINNSSSQYEMLKKERAEEFSEFAAFRYAEKKRARDQGTVDKDKTIPTTNDNFQDLRPKARKTGKNQRRKETNNEQVEAQEKSERVLLEKEEAVVLSQMEKLRKWNKEYASEFTSIAQIARGEVPRVIEAARSARRTLRNIQPLITARYVRKAKEWQITTDVAFKIPHFVEGENVIKLLKGKVTTETPLGLFETVTIEEEQTVLDTQKESDNPLKSSNEASRNSPRAFSPLIAKMPESTQLRPGMIWKPWRTVTEVPYSILADTGISTELLATVVAHIVSTGQLEGDEDLESKAHAINCEIFYRSDASDAGSDAGSWEGDDEQDGLGQYQELEKDSSEQVELDGVDVVGDLALSPLTGSGPETVQEALGRDTDKEDPPT